MTFVTDTTDGDVPKDDEKPRPRRARARDPLAPDGEIGTRLRALYAEVEREPIPMQLIDLLEKLSEAERKAAK